MKYKFNPKGFFIKLFFFVLALFALSFPLLAQNYADGSGRGSLQHSIFWLTWTNGLTSQPPGSDSSIVTAGVYTWQFTPGVKVIATVSNINPITKNSALRPYTSGSNASNPDGFGVLYPGLKGQGLRDSLFAANIKFDISVDLQMLINGTWKSVAFPGLVVGDAETLATDRNFSNLNEYIKASAVDANTSWQLLDFRKEFYSQFPQDYKIEISNGGKDFKAFIDNSINTNDGGDNFLQSVMFAKNARSLANIQTQGRGYTAVSLGLVAPFDFGDAPSSFGNAGSYISDVNYSTIPKLVDSVYTAMTMPQIKVSPYTKLYLGNDNTDADGNPPNSQAASIDNFTNYNDEDGFKLSSQPGIYVNNANNLFMTVTATNKQSTPATIYGWVDFDGNGLFSSNELATGIVPAGAVSLPVLLTFDYGKFGKIIKQGTTYARFRITTTKLIDNPSTATVDERSTGIAIDGETEDYKLNDITFGNISKPIGVDDVDSTPIRTPITNIVKSNDLINSYFATVNIANPPTSGKAIVNVDGSVTYTPDSSFTGIDTYTYTLTTPAGLASDPINVVVFVKPKGVYDSVNTPINTSIDIKVKANDGIEESKNLVSLASNPSNGTVTMSSDSTLNYTPTVNFIGLDTFTYILTTPDNISSSPIMVIVKIVPLGVDDLDSTFINKPITTSLKANDGNGALIDTLKIATNPADGTLKINKDGTVTYLPAKGFTGKDTYTYTLTDNVGVVTQPITVIILVKPIGVLNRDTTIVNNPISIDVKANDSAKGGKDAVQITNTTKHGTTTVNADNTITYTPDIDFIGKDTCYYTLVTPDSVSSAPIPVYLTVIPQIKKADILIRKTLDTKGKLIAGETINFTLTVSNNGPDNATNVLVKDTLAANIANATILTTQIGTANYDIPNRILSWNIGNLSNSQTVTLTFKTIIDSGTSVSNKAYVTAKEPDPDTTNNHSSIGIVAIQVVPVGVQDLDSTLINNPIITTVKGNDGTSNANALVTEGTNPANGTVKVNPDGTIAYTPNKGFTGKDTYTYTLTSDSGIVSQPITVTIKVKPVGVLDRDTTYQNKVITFTVKTNDSAQGGNNAVNIVSNTKNGIVKVNVDGTVTYTPNNNFVGNDTCYYTLTTIDSLSSDPVAIYLTVLPPVKKADISIKKTFISTGNLIVGQTISFSINVTNNGLDNATGIVVRDTLAANISNATLSQPQTGSASYDKLSRVLVWNIGSLTSGLSTSLTYTTTIDSGKFIENTAFVSSNEIDPDTTNNRSSIGKVSIFPMPIFGVQDLDSTFINATVVTSVKANDSAKNALDTVKIATNPIYGVVNVNSDGTISYLPNIGFTGKDTYSYTLSNINGAISPPVTVTIKVKPVGVFDRDTTYQNKAITFAVKTNDSAQAKNNTVIIATATNNGTIKLNNDGTLTYTPNDNFIGKDTCFYMLATADSVISSPIAVFLTVIPPIKIADISIKKTLITSGALTIGQTISFTLTATNNGPDDATGVISRDTLAKNINNVTITLDTTGIASYIKVSRILFWNIGSLAANKSTTLTFSTIIDSGKSISNTAYIIANESDPDTTNNYSKVTKVPVLPMPIYGVSDLDSTIINKAIIINLKLNDSVKNALDTVKIASNPSNGTVVLNSDGTVTYTPNLGYLGKDFYTYTLTNADGVNSSSIKVTVLVKPVGVDDKDTTEQNKPITTAVKSNDEASGKTTSVSIVNQPTHGQIVLNSNGTVTYIPDSTFIGTDIYKYVLLTADSLASSPITTTIVVTPPIPKSADLSILKELTTNGSVTISEEITFKITIINNGPNDATGVTVTDVLAANLERPTSLYSSNVGTISYNTNSRKITWNVGGVAAGQVVTLTFNTIIDSGAYLNNAAIVKGNEPDPDSTNNISAITPMPIYPADLFIPNVITPNGDGKNDKFVIVGLPRFPNSGLSIFNRWDNMVYTTPDYQNNWDGTGLSSGTYYYVLKLKLFTGAVEVKKGWVMVIK